MDSNLNILSLYYFVVLAKELHMTHAAKKLYITQQNLSQHIQKLEAHYGVELFVRKPKMALTIEGEQLYDTASKILSEEEDIVNKFSIISQKSIGRLRMRAPRLLQVSMTVCYIFATAITIFALANKLLK